MYFGFGEEVLSNYVKRKQTVGDQKSGVYLSRTWASDSCSGRTKAP